MIEEQSKKITSLTKLAFPNNSGLISNRHRHVLLVLVQISGDRNRVLSRSLGMGISFSNYLPSSTPSQHIHTDKSRLLSIL